MPLKGRGDVMAGSGSEAKGAEAAEGTDGRPVLAGVPTVTADESQQIDRVAVDEGIALSGMVNRAGYLSAKILQDGLLQDLLDKELGDVTVTVLAGTGNKGAAALVAGRHLAEAGATLNVVLARKAKEYAGDSKDALQKVEKVAKKVYAGYNERAFDQADLIIDGLIGAGLAGTPKASVSLLIKGANFSMKPVIALDVPSGLDATTGVQSPVTIKASATFVVGLPKRGMLGKTNTALCGRVYLLDIGVPPALWQTVLGVDVSGVFDGKEYVRLETADESA